MVRMGVRKGKRGGVRVATGRGEGREAEGRDEGSEAEGRDEGREARARGQDGRCQRGREVERGKVDSLSATYSAGMS